MSVVLVVRMKIAEGNVPRALELLRELTAKTRAEPGCRLYVPCRDLDDPSSILLFEEYDDETARDAHWASEHFNELAAGGLFKLLESRERATYETI